MGTSDLYNEALLLILYSLDHHCLLFAVVIQPQIHRPHLLLKVSMMCIITNIKKPFCIDTD